MKYIIATSLAFFALAFVILPPLDLSASVCSFTITDADDSIFNCSVTSRSVFRVNNSQASSFSFSERISLRTGNNNVYAGDDVQSATVSSGPANVTYSRTSVINRFVLTIN